MIELPEVREGGMADDDGGIRKELYATVVEQRSGTYHERINRHLRKARKDRIDVAAGAGVEDFDLLPNDQSRRPDA